MSRLSVFLSLAICLPLAQGIPTGLSAFFDASECPPQWNRLTVANGRLIVSVNDTSIAGITIGVPLADREDRRHAHTFSTTITLVSKHIAADGCCDKIGAHSGSYPIANNTERSTSGYPFTQLLLCEYGGTDSGEPLAFGTVAYFAPSVRQCPKGWVPDTSVAGRFLVPSYEEGGAVSNGVPALQSGEDRLHSHSYSVSVPTDSVSYVGVDGCCNDSPAAAQTPTIAGTTSTSPAGLPYVQLLTCTSQSFTFNLSLPESALMFNAIGCPAGWEVENAVSGRLLVGLHPGGAAGASFGGNSLPSSGKSNPTHSHVLGGTVNFPHSDIGLAEGCCASGYMGGQPYAYSGPSDSTTDNLPYTMLPLCRKKASVARR